MNVLITGGNGYIAQSIKNNLIIKYNILNVTRNEFDLTDSSSTKEFFENKFFDVVIHTAVIGGSRLKKDNKDTVYQNLKMIYNLYDNKNSFKKLITFGSGAEIFQNNTPYGISKNAINEIINNIHDWYNLRIFGVFDHNELETRFIKSNILRYIKKDAMIIHNNKIMDFYYMEDLISLVDFYINNEGPKNINCSYENKYTLKSIAEKINCLSNYKVPIIIENNKELEFYCGNSHGINIPEIGLDLGIINTYNQLKDLYYDTNNK